jgi:hypothetical protein
VLLKCLLHAFPTRQFNGAVSRRLVRRKACQFTFFSQGVLPAARCIPRILRRIQHSQTKARQARPHHEGRYRIKLLHDIDADGHFACWRCGMSCNPISDLRRAATIVVLRGGNPPSMLNTPMCQALKSRVEYTLCGSAANRSSGTTDRARGVLPMNFCLIRCVPASGSRGRQHSSSSLDGLCGASLLDRRCSWNPAKSFILDPIAISTWPFSWPRATCPRNARRIIATCKHFPAQGVQAMLDVS